MPTVRRKSLTKAKTPVKTSVRAPLALAKKTAKPRAKPDDLGKLKNIAKKLLRQFELSLKPPAGASEEAIKRKYAQHELMFGKNSQASVLVMLTELILKIDQAKLKMHSAAAGDMPAFHADALSDADMALIEAFVQRMKSQPTF